MKNVFGVLLAMSFALAGNSALAQSDLTCADIDFSYEITSRYPDAMNGCLDVVEVNGERFAKMTVELVRTGRNSAVFRFKHPDGSFGPTQRAELDADWRAEIGGREYRISQLQRGQELNVYLPSDRWEAHIEPVTAVFVTYYGYPLADDMGDSGAGASLPATASSLPAIALFGGATLFTAFLMGVYRRRSRK